MLKTIKRHSLGVWALFLIILNIIALSTPIILGMLLKLLIPIPAWRKLCSQFLNNCANTWATINNKIFMLTGKTQWHVEGLEHVDMKKNYIVLANHQSWVDILVLQKIFTWKIPSLKFFIKDSLKWIPVLGIVWWALDFPFLKRYSKEQLEENPHLKQKDIIAAQKACEKIKILPTTVMIFAEGTRFCEAKRIKQQSPYSNLLKPKAGGVAQVMKIMGPQINYIYDVTIHYPVAAPTLWKFLCAEIKRINVRVRMIPVNADFIGDYYQDQIFQAKFCEKINALWQEKQLILNEMRSMN